MATWADVRELLRDRTERKPFWTTDELRDAFNESLSLWNLLVGQWRRSATFPSVANQYEYVLPSTMTYRTRMTFNSLPIESSSREELNMSRPRWRSQTTATGGDVPTRIALFAPISLQLVYLWPADAVGGGTIVVEGISTTPVMTEDGDTVDLTNDHLDLMLDFSVHVLSVKKGMPGIQATMPAYRAFLAAAADQNSVIKTATVYRRAMGLDQRDLKPLRGVPSRLDSMAEAG